MLARGGLTAAAMIGMLWPSLAGAQTAAPVAEPAQITLPPVEIVGTTPLVAGIGIDRDKVPSNMQTLPARTSPGRAGAARLGPRSALSSVNLNDNEDNPYQPDVQYRGFTASPVLGTPTGIAVYQNGVRLNEPFGDNLTWDLVPDFAIDRLSIIPTNPVYGLNALGGALVLK